MKTLQYDGEFLTEKLRSELVDAGVPETWAEGGEPCVLVVQQEEDLAVAYEEPLLDDDYEFILDGDGMPQTEIVWRRPGGEVVEVPESLVPDNATQGAHVQLGPGHILVAVPDTMKDAAVAKVVAEHDPTPAEPEPSLADRVADLEARLTNLP